MNRLELPTVNDLLLKAVNDFYDNLIQPYALYAAELEFYIPHRGILTIGSEEVVEMEKNLLYQSAMTNPQFIIENLEAEDGINQFEVQFKPTNNPALLAEWICNARDYLVSHFNADFTSKLFLNQPGSSMHIHVSLHCERGNLFLQNNNYNADNLSNESIYSELLYYAVAGLLHDMKSNMSIFAPTENCKLRFRYPRKNQQHIHYPVNCSWGVNNRTCAIRIPKKFYQDNINCRIEHRVSSSVANPFDVLECIIKSITTGIEEQFECPEQVFGNAFALEYSALPLLID